MVVHKPTAPLTTPAPAAPIAAVARPAIAIDNTADEFGKLTTTLGEPGIALTTATVTVMSPQDTDALLARAEPLPKLDHRSAPVLRPPSAPPPRTGTTEPIAFVAQTGKVIADRPVSPTADKPPGSVAMSPPQILPVDEVPAESEVRVRFTEPMVPVATVGESKAQIATIKPAVPGTWRWLDTRVAQFTSSTKRFPMATEFTVTVPAGTKAISGAVLVTDVTQTFKTPPVSITGTYPSVALRPDSPVLVTFDQKVDAAKIHTLLRVVDSRGHKLPFAPTTLAEAQKRWARNPSATYDGADVGPNYLILAPQGAWPPGTTPRVVLGAKAPSLEGARVSTQETGASFDVAPTFVVRGIECDRVERARMTGAGCPANNYLTVRFSNRIDESTYRSKKIQVAGEPFYDHQPDGDSVTLESPLKVGGSYTISVGDGIQDVYGQPLVGDRELAFVTNRVIHDPYVAARGGVYVLDPRFEIPQWVINTQAIASLHVELHQVDPDDFFAFQAYEHGDSKTLPGKRVFQQDYKVGAREGATARIDLRPALLNGTGHVIASVTAEPAPGARKFEKEQRKETAWIQVSRLGFTARIDGERVHAWTHDITPAKFLQPIPGATMSMLVEGRTDTPPPVIGDAMGHAAYDLLPRADIKPGQRSPTALLLARLGTDSTFSALNRYEKSTRHNNARWYVTDDRFTYRPGEPVYLKGWVRWIDDGINPELRMPASGERLSYTLTDSRGNRVASGVADFTKQGGFDLTVNLPANVNLGTAMFAFATKTERYRHPISIEEFRTPAYSVSMTDDVLFSGSRPLFLGDSISMSTEAKYYAGGGMAGSEIQWNATLESASYRPPGWDRYTFDPPRPRSQRDYWNRYYDEKQTTAHETGTLSGASTSTIEIGIAALPQGRTSVLEVDSTVTDIDRQTIRATSRKIVVHPASVYVGLRIDPENLRQLQAVVTDLDGNLVEGVPLTIDITGVLGSERNRDDAQVIDTQACKLTSLTTPVVCTFTRKDDMTSYTAVARIKDSRGRENIALFDIPWWAYADQDLQVTPDKATYKPGDVAKLVVSSKLKPAAAIITFARNGVMSQQRVDLTAAPATVELPITSAYIENVKVVVDRLTKRRNQNISKTVPASSLPIAANDSIEINLPVDLASARLSMRTRPLQALVEPGEQASFEVEVKHDDAPVKGAEVALIVVDEAVLAISGKRHGDPLEPFYAAVEDGTWSAATQGMIEDAGDDLGGSPGFKHWSLDTPGRGGSGSGTGYGYGGGRGGMSGRSASAPSVSVGAVIKARKDFRATATFSPRLETDASGKVRLTVKMPDNLTRYRIVALATSGPGLFGKAENNIVAQRKVNARTVAPRFLTQGDTFSVPVVVQNLDAVARSIDVVVRAANLTAVGPQGKRVVVPAGERAEVRFDFATQTRGKAVIQTVAATGTFADSSNVEIPVYEPATTESFATYGSVTDKPQFEQLKVPADVFPEVGGIEAEISSTQLQNLTDAYWYLYAYPYECAEQRSSRMIATTSMFDILEAFATGDRPTKQEITEQRAFDLRKLARDQLPDGSWGYYRGMAGDPFVTMQVLTALALQGEKGAVTKNAIDYVTKRATAILTALQKELKARDVRLQNRGDDAANISLAAMALSSLAATGTDVSARAVQLNSVAVALGTYPVDAKARLLAVVAGKPPYKELRAKLLAGLLSAVHETAAAATVTAAFSEQEQQLLLVSETKTTALALDAILREQPAHALVTKLARGLLDGRRRGRWVSTQENVVVLQTMRRYFDIYEKETPRFTGKLWLGSSTYAEQAFSGRGNARAVTFADWSMLKPGTLHDITIDKTGSGRMYYRLGITYAPRATNLPPLDAGFVVRRTYKAVDNPSDVVQQPDGSWRVKLGARVLVQLEALNSSARHAVALVDQMPAGFESVNTRLATAERAVVDLDADQWDYTSMRDNRSEVFTMHLPEGSHHFSYTARATTPGTFIAAPAKAEEMYNPETFGRSAGTTVVVQ